MSKLTLTDDAGNTEEIALPADVTVTIKPPAPPPPTPPLKASFVAKMDHLTANVIDTSTGGTPPLKVHYTFAGTGGADCAGGGTVTHAFPDASQRNIVQTVTDANGNTATSNQFVYPTFPPASAPPPANKPPDPPAAPPPPKAAFTATVDGNVVTVQDQTTGATSESLDFGDGTVMDG